MVRRNAFVVEELNHCREERDCKYRGRFAGRLHLEEGYTNHSVQVWPRQVA